MSTAEYRTDHELDFEFFGELSVGMIVSRKMGGYFLAYVSMTVD